MSENNNMSIDEILASLSEEKKKDAPEKTWSMSEIDKLLGIDKQQEETLDRKAEVINSLFDKTEDAEPENDDASEDEAFEKEAFEEKAFEEKTVEAEAHKERFFKGKAVKEKIVEEKTFEEESVEAEAREEISAEEESVEPKADTIEIEKPLSQKTRIFDSHKKSSEENGKSEVFAEEISENQTQVIVELADSESEETEFEPTFEKDIPASEEKKPEDEASRHEKKALAQKTVGIYPVRNENIDHQIVTEKIEKSHIGGMATDKYRERFLNVPKQKIERTADYERLHVGEEMDPIERDGRIIKKSKFTNTADLEPIPTIVSADAELSSVDKTIVANGKNPIVHDEDDGVVGQIKLVGFGEEEEIPQIDEDNAEEALKEKRDRKVAAFKLDADFAELPEENPEEEPHEEEKASAAGALISDFIDDEYEKPEDKSRIIKKLAGAKKVSGICAIVQAVLTVIALIITGIVSKSGGNLELIGGSAVVCGVINIVILLIAAFCGISTLIRGAKGLFSKKPNAATGTFIVVLSCLIEDLVVTFFTSDAYTTVSLYTAAGCLALTLSTVARYLAVSRTYGNFEFVTNGTKLYSSEKISGEDDAFEIGRGLLIGDPEICYNAQMERPSYFIENSFEDDPADEFAKRLIYPVVGAALLMAVIFGVVRKDVVFAVGVFTAVCSIGIPAFSTIASNIALFAVNKGFNKNGAAIVGHRAVADSVDVNAYVLDSTDIFRKGSCNIIGIKTFQSMRIDDAILYAAALVIESGGPLADIFDGVILGKKDLLPPVESLAYEERLGLSAWIHGRRILLGTRELLVNHNVNAPDRNFEAQYTHDGRNVIYLAIAGKISAMFVIKYQADKHMRKYLQNVDKAGVSLLVRSCDCNITEEMICRFFGLPLSAVKILSPVSGDIFEKYREEEIETAPAGIIHNGTIEASLRGIYEARELQANVPVNNIISTLYSGIALVLFIILSILAGKEGFGITGGQIVLFQLLWGVVATAIPLLRRRLDK